MNLIERPSVEFDNGIVITFRIPLTEKEELKSTLESIENFDLKTDYTLSFTKTKKHRSMDANSYMWVLCDKIAKVIQNTKEEVYRDAIRHVGVFSDVAVQAGLPCKALVNSWGGNGIGYFAEVFSSTLRDKDGNPMNRVRLYEGSHGYDSVAMARLVDYVVEQAKNLDIETLTENKIRELESSWNN